MVGFRTAAAQLAAAAAMSSLPAASLACTAAITSSRLRPCSRNAFGAVGWQAKPHDALHAVGLLQADQAVSSGKS